MKTSDLFVKALENEGVEFIFGIPGEENLDLLNSLKGSKIRFILVRHEQAAGFMAATYGRLTGSPGVCLATLGPGATNLVTAAAYAQLGGMPMLMITGQKPIMKSKQGQFQIINIVDMMKPLTKYTKQIVHSHTLPSRVRKAFKLAREERPGPVHIELPEDIAREDCDADVFAVTANRQPVADTHTVIEAVQMIQKARSPLFLLGAGANRRKCHDAVEYLIERTGIPFFTTQMGKGVMDERNPLCLGTAALSSQDFVHRAIERSDLIINIGHNVTEKPPFFMRKGGLNVIHVSAYSAAVDEVYFPQLEVIGDIAKNVAELSQQVEPQPHWDFAAFLRIKERMEAHREAGACSDCFPVVPSRLVRIVRDAMPPNGVIALDNGIYKIWFARDYPAYEPNTVLLDNALATMGAGLASAMAAKLICPDQKVMAICGDGGFLMNCQELETAVRLKLDLVVLVLNDGAYGMIKWKQEMMKFDDTGMLDFGNPDFVKFAESFGATGHRLSATKDLGPLLNTCLSSPGVHVIDIPMDYSQNHQVLNIDLPAITKDL